MVRRWQVLISCIAMLPAACAAAADDVRVADQGLFARLDTTGDGLLTTRELPDNQARLFARLVRQGDSNGDGQLTEKEWRAATRPRRPAKPIEEKQSTELPGADEIRLLLLKLDVNTDGVLTKEEAPAELKRTFEQIVDGFDRNNDGRINTLELARGGQRLRGLAQRNVRRLDLDVERELKKFDRQQGDQAMRFSNSPRRVESMRTRQGALALFELFDTNKDGKLQRDEIPEGGAGRWIRFFRAGDRDGDGQLSQQEYMGLSARALRIRRMMSNTAGE